MNDPYNTTRYEPIPLYHGHPRSKAVVLGAREDSGNIGDAIVRALTEERGWAVLGDDCAAGDGSRPPGGNLPNDEVAEQHGYVVTDKGRFRRYVVPSVQDFGRWNADALIVSLGTTNGEHFADVMDWTIANMLKANLELPLVAANHFVKATEKDRRLAEGEGEDWRAHPLKHIVFIGSYGYQHPFTNGTSYCAAKAGLDMAARTLGWELTDRGYRVHVVHPYHVAGTPMWEASEQDFARRRPDLSPEEQAAYHRKDLKMPDMLSAPEVADAVVALLTVPALGWVTRLNMFGGAR